MKKTEIFFILFMMVAGFALAESVTTTDGVNFNVTNDVNFTDVLTNAQILQKVSQSNRAVMGDSLTYLADSETLYSWQGVEQLAQQAASDYQANQVSNQTN